MTKDRNKSKLRRRRVFRRPPPGTSPGSLHVDSLQTKPVIDIIAYNEDECEIISSAPIQKLQELIAKKSMVVWANITGLGDANILSEIGKICNLHTLTLEDIVNVHQRPKVDFFDTYLYLTIYMLQNNIYEKEQLSIVIGPNFVLTYQETPGDCLEPIRDRIRRKIGRIRRMKSDYLGYAIVDTSIDHYFPLAEAEGKTLEELEDSIFNQSGLDFVKKVHEAKLRVHRFYKIIWSHRDMLLTLLKNPDDRISSDTIVYFRDCYDHMMQLRDYIGHLKDTAPSLMDLHLALSTQRNNDVMRFLTVIAAIFIPLTFIAGIYGMNFDTASSPYNMPELKWYYGYPFALGLMAVTAVIMIIYFYRKHWLTDE